jgi:hypothetical protein
VMQLEMAGIVGPHVDGHKDLGGSR